MQPHRWTVLDALRGLAALAVVLSHVADPRNGGGSAETPSTPARAVAGLFEYGRVGVVLFFVISGFCIHLRWARARATGGTAAVEFASFWRRRLIRLYPPYLAALLLFVAAESATGEFTWGRADLYDLALHLALLHNLDGRTVFGIDGVFWTLAIEEQLYLAYFLLLPLRDRLGWARTLALCAGARLAWFGLAFAVGRLGTDFHLAHDSGSPAHWFTWALGAVSVEAAVGLVALPAWASRLRWAGLFALAAVGCDLATGRHLGGPLAWRATWLVGSPLWGLAFFVTVNRLIRAEATWRAAGRPPAAPIRALAGLGLFSYSLYLTHNLVLKQAGPHLLNRLGLADDVGGRLLLVPPALACAWAFFLACERPFLRRAKPPTPGDRPAP